MAKRELTLEYSMINIVTHPHSPKGYVDLFRDAFVLKYNCKVRGSDHLMLGNIGLRDVDDEHAVVFGTFYKFVYIDRDAPWLNVDNLEEATGADLSRLVIPENLFPNMAQFPFVFYPDSHRLLFATKSGKSRLSAEQARTYLTNLFRRDEIEDKYGLVEVTIIPDPRQLERILKLPTLQKLVVDLIKPNPDDLGDEDDEVFKRMDEDNIRRIREELYAEKNRSLKVPEPIAKLARVASDNGFVEGSGYDENRRKVKASTADKPLVRTERYNPRRLSPYDVLANILIFLSKSKKQ